MCVICTPWLELSSSGHRCVVEPVPLPESERIVAVHRVGRSEAGISLPEIDGWETTRRLKASSRTAAIPVIALTAHAMVSDREKCLAAGCDEFETKPIDLRRLLDKMQALIVTEAAS